MPEEVTDPVARAEERLADHAEICRAELGEEKCLCPQCDLLRDLLSALSRVTAERDALRDGGWVNLDDQEPSPDNERREWRTIVQWRPAPPVAEQEKK